MYDSIAAADQLLATPEKTTDNQPEDTTMADGEKEGDDDNSTDGERERDNNDAMQGHVNREVAQENLSAWKIKLAILTNWPVAFYDLGANIRHVCGASHPTQKLASL